MLLIMDSSLSLLSSFLPKTATVLVSGLSNFLINLSIDFTSSWSLLGNPLPYLLFVKFNRGFSSLISWFWIKVLSSNFSSILSNCFPMVTKH